MLVDQIIAAKKQYDENDRPWLSKLADGQLNKIAASCGCAHAEPAEPTPAVEPAPAPTVSAAAPVVEPAPAPAPVVAAAAPEKPLTAEEWIEKTPEHLRGVFGDLLAQRRAREVELRQKIVAQSRGALTAEYLASKALDELEMLSAGTRQPDYSGRGIQSGDPIAQASAPTSAPRMPGIPIGKPAAA